MASGPCFQSRIGAVPVPRLGLARMGAQRWRRREATGDMIILRYPGLHHDLRQVSIGPFSRAGLLR
jgi:hypothetical protein